MEALIGFLGVFAAIVAAWIGYSQGRAVERRELFDRRLPIVRKMEQSLRTAINSTDRQEVHNAFFDYVSAERDAAYLFGPEIGVRLTGLRQDFANINAFWDVAEDNPERGKMIEKKYASMERIAGFLLTAPDVFAPYMRFGGPIPASVAAVLRRIGFGG